MNACFGLSSNGVWTSSDEIALEFLYGTGGVGSTVWDVADTQSNQSASGGVETAYGPYDATGLNAIRFSISGGTGDADLYVRHGAAPTTASYDCRPYIGGNEESCEFNPSQDGNYYVMVRAYSAYSGVTLTVETSGGGGGGGPDPEICDNGLDDDGDGITDCADSDCAADPSCAPDPEICDNGIDDDGDGDADCSDSDCTGDPVCAPGPGGWTELFSQGFESGWGNFNDGGSDARRSINDAAYANTGSYCVQLRDNSGVASSTFSNSFSLSGYSDLEIDFYFIAISMENGEDFFVELWNGSQWIVVGQAIAGTNFNNGTRYHATIPVSSSDVNFSSTAALRFRADASNNSDYVYIDDITVSAQ
ncbi:MAG: pre-peptidase C-terminal domain-containing protein [Myxococcales bacterium]|nr:pre-peptidase C-terminal domain-containing protein [Myxococcales bacterium]